MKKLLLILALLPLILSANAFGWHVKGYVVCDTQPNGIFDIDDSALAGVGVNVVQSPSGVLIATAVSDAGAYYYTALPDVSDTYEISLDPATLPADAEVTIPAGGSEIFSLDDSVQSTQVNFLVDSAVCRDVPPDGCWMTGGGVKFEPLVDADMATHGPRDTLGGNVFPSCDSEPGNGGQWNHVAHSAKEHYQAFDVHTVRCGNVPDHPPGSESPVTSVNFIEWEGTGRMQGIKGNKSSFGDVYFFGRAEDRNEPGSEGPADGGNIDRYFLHAWVYGAGGAQMTLICIDEDGDCTTVDPVTISGGNLQLHESSCD